MSATGSLLLTHIGVLATCDPELGRGPLGLVPDAAVLCRGDRIEYAGPLAELPALHGDEPLTLDLDGHLVTPGLIDCHTHLVFAGDRLDDYEARLAGETYTSIAARGGGILSTVNATRAASDALLSDLAEARIERLVAHGVTTIEVKSGYGLEARHELRMLDVIRRCARRVIADLVPTFLGAHTVPAEGRRSDEARRAYVDSIVETMIPAVVEGRKARFCDVFIEQGAFTVDEGRRILEAARKAGLALQVHADQLSHTGATALAAELGATCAAHLEHATDEDLATLAAAGTVAVLLPGASFFLRDTPADGRRMREAGLDVAVGSDFNPGSSPTANLLLAAQMAVLHSGLTLPEALLAITANAARALDLHKDRGRVRAGLRADLAMFRCRDYRELFYEFGTSPCTGVVKDGEYHRVEAARTDRVRLQI